MLDLFDPALSVLHLGVVAIAVAIQPLVGEAAVALALIAITLAVRALLLPLAIRVHRATQPRHAIGPALAQAPFMLLLYRLCHVPLIAGAPNAIWAAGLFGAPLAEHGPVVLAGAGLFSGPGLVVATLLLAGLALAIASGRQATTRLRAAAAGGEVPPSTIGVVRVLPFGAVAAMAFVPLAVCLYLVTSTAWTVAERALLTRFG